MSDKLLTLDDQAVVERLHELDLELTEVLNRELPMQWVVKEDSKIMQLIVKGLDIVQDVRAVAHLFGVDIPLAAPSGTAFMSLFGTTTKQTAALPRKWYEVTPLGVRARWSCRGHEWQHGFQDYRGVKDMPGWPKFLQHSVLYLAGCIAHTPDGEEYLGKVEGDAYAVTAYPAQFFSDAPPPLEGSLVSLRSSYNLLGNGNGMAIAEDILRAHYTTLASGGCPNVTAARLTKEFLMQHAQDLKGRVVL